VIRIAGRIWDSDAIRSVRSMWENELLPIAMIAAAHGVKANSLKQPRSRRALGLKRRRLGAKPGASAGRACYHRPPELKHAHPLVRRIINIAIKQRVPLRDAAKTAGVNSHTVSNWRRSAPRVETLEAFGNALGWRLKWVTIKEAE
jgi:DNA invertase Pin-like site-specific DNA recombinase